MLIESSTNFSTKTRKNSRTFLNQGPFEIYRGRAPRVLGRTARQIVNKRNFRSHEVASNQIAQVRFDEDENEPSEVRSADIMFI